MAVGLSLLIWSATDLPLTTSGTTEGATSGTGAAISLPLARRRRLHPRSSSRHHRRGLNESPYAEVGHLFGSVSDDFVAPVSLGGQTFLLVVDTGSAALAVAGGPNLGCRRYLDTADHCDLNTPVECLYGSGGWKGVDCRRDVRIGGLDVPGYELSAITEEEAFLTCPESPADSPTAPAQMLRHDMLIEGIVGLSLRGLGGPTNTSLPLLHALFHAHHRLPRSFGLQCCPYDAESGRGGDGALDIGGADRSHYQGDGFAYAAVVAAEAGFWGVDVQALRVAGSDLPLLRDEPSDGSSGGGGALDRRGRAKYIVDSGTSLLLFRPRTFLSLKHALLASLAPGTGPPPTHGFWNATACVGAGEIDISSLPTIELTLRGDVRGEGEVESGVTLRIPATRYARRTEAAACGLGSDEGEAGGSSVGPFYSLDIAPALPEGSEGILGQVLFEAYYVHHDLADDASAPSATPHALAAAAPFSTSTATSAATAATAAPPRIGFAPIAGCDDAHDNPADSHREAAARPAEATGGDGPPDSGGGGDARAASGHREQPFAYPLPLALAGLIACGVAAAVALRSIRQKRLAAASPEGVGADYITAPYSPFLQPDQWSNASPRHPWAIDAAPGLWGLDTRATHTAGLEAGLEGPASGGALLSERSHGLFAPRAVRLVHPGLTMSGWGLSPSSSAFHTSPSSSRSRASSVPSAPASAEPAEDPASDYVRM